MNETSHPPRMTSAGDILLTDLPASLWQAAEAISGELSPPRLLEQIAYYACNLLGGDGSQAGLLTPAGNAAHLVTGYGLPAGAWGQGRFNEEVFTRQLLLEQQPLIQNDDGLVEAAHLALDQSMIALGLPLFSNRRLVGFFVIGLAVPRSLARSTLETLILFARQAGLALKNAQYFEAEKNRTARLATINYTSRLITSSLDLDQLLQTTVEAITHHLKYSNVAILLVDLDHPDTLVLRARGGAYAMPEIDGYRQSIDQGIIGAAARSRQPVLVNDVRADTRYIPIPQYEDIRAELAVPIVVNNRLLGVLNIESERLFTADDTADFEIIAGQLGIALEKGYLFAETQRALAEAQLLYQTSQRIGMALDVDEVVVAYLKQVATQGRYACNIVLYQFEETGRRVTVEVRGRWTPEEGLVYLPERHPYTQDELDPILDAGETITFADVHTDPRAPASLRKIQAQADRPALALIPLMVRGERIGLVVLSYAQVHHWDVMDLQPYQATAAQLATAIDSRRQQQLLYERGQQLAVLQERQRLARDLHDSVTQLIFSITLIAQSLSPAWRRDPVEGERRTNRLLELGQLALAEMRALLAELRPAETTIPVLKPEQPPSPEESNLTPASGTLRLKQQGLVAALRKYIETITREGLQVKFETESYQPQSFACEEALYRISQEAFNNIMKHAQAREVQFTLRSDRAGTYLSVSDDGVGFASEGDETYDQVARPQAATPPLPDQNHRHLGLTSMQERAEALGGIFRLTSWPGRGTSIEVKIPSNLKKG